LASTPRRRLTLLAAGLLGGLLVLEGGLRIAGAAVKTRDDRHTTAAGLSDHRVLALGACYTVGVGSRAHQSYPRQLEALLDERHPELDLSVVNGGIRGKSIAYFADYIDAILDDVRPEVLIVNVNDRLTWTPDDVAALQGVLDSPVALARRKADRLLGGLVLYRVVRLALTPPPDQTGLPKDWWSQGPGGQDTTDQLAQAIAQAEAAVARDPQDPVAWTELARLSERRLDPERAIQAHQRAIELGGGRPLSHHHRQLARTYAGLRQHAAAARHLDEARSATEGYQWMLAEQLRNDRVAVPPGDPLEAMVHQVKEADYHALFGDLQESVRLLQEVVDTMPSMLQAHDMLLFYRALQRSLSTGQPLAEQAPVDRAALFDKDHTGEARFGVASPQAAEGETDAEERLRVVLEDSLRRIVRAAEARDVAVIVENLSSLPAQASTIEALTEAYDLPLVDLQGALAIHPDRASLLHPTLNLRLSAEGNRFVAEQIYAALEEEELLR